MSLSDLASLGSFVSGVAVLASLGFLFFQMRQMTEQVRQAERYQRAAVQQGRAARVSEMSFHMADPELQEAISKVMDGDPDISLTQLRQYRHIFRAGTFNLEDTFHQHKAGLIDDDVFAGMCSTIRFTAARVGWRAMWREQRANWANDFTDFVDQIVAEIPVSSPTSELASWRANVAAERDGKH